MLLNCFGRNGISPTLQDYYMISNGILKGLYFDRGIKLSGNQDVQWPFAWARCHADRAKREGGAMYQAPQNIGDYVGNPVCIGLGLGLGNG